MTRSQELLDAVGRYPAGTERHLANLRAIDALVLELQDEHLIDATVEHLNETNDDERN